MTVKIVTDSSADLPVQMAQELGITVVPLYVRFGEEVYRERVDITDDQFYHRLINGPIHPVTSQPTPQDFADAYQKLSAEADGIVSIHISSKLSGTHNSAVQGKAMLEKACPIEVVDSKSITMTMGLVAIAAARMAATGAGLQQVLEFVNREIPNINLLGLLDTLKYLQLGGRIGKAKALLGSILNVKPMVTIRDGEVHPVANVRTRTKGIQRLIDFAKSAQGIEDLAIAQATTPEDAQALAEQMAEAYTKGPVKVVRLGTTLGVHAGPGTLLVAFRGKAAA
ncbi:DegV family protein [Chloroflexota bacterium]